MTLRFTLYFTLFFVTTMISVCAGQSDVVRAGIAGLSHSHVHEAFMTQRKAFMSSFEEWHNDKP